MTVKITEVENVKRTLLRVEGKITNSDAEMLKRTVGAIDTAKTVQIDLSGVTFIDEGGVSIIKRFERDGARLTGIDFFIKAVIDAHSNK